VLILFDDAGLVHYGDGDEDVRLLSKAATGAGAPR